MGQTVTLLGATGLIGSHLLDILLNDETYSQVNVITRKATGKSHSKLNETIFDFGNLKGMNTLIAGSETVFCAVGTTSRKVHGDRHEYQKVDYDIPMYAAKVAADSGAFGFALVSAIGANPDNNNNYYLKLKGVVEEAVSKILIPQLIIVRPSLLIGKRKESRIGESIAQFVMPAVSWVLPSSLNKYKSIRAGQVALAMVKATQTLPNGIHMLEYNEMIKLISPQQAMA